MKLFICVLAINFVTNVTIQAITVEGAQIELEKAKATLVQAKDAAQIADAKQKVEEAQKTFDEIVAQATAEVNKLARFQNISDAIKAVEQASESEKLEKLNALTQVMEATTLMFLAVGNLIVDKNDLIFENRPDLYRKLNDLRKGPFEDAIKSANMEIAKHKDFVKKLVEEKIGPLAQKVANLSDNDLADVDKVVSAVRVGGSLGGFKYYIIAALYTPFAEKTYPKALKAMKTLNYDVHKSINYNPESNVENPEPEINKSDQTNVTRNIMIGGGLMALMAILYKYRSKIRAFVQSHFGKKEEKKLEQDKDIINQNAPLIPHQYNKVS